MLDRAGAPSLKNLDEILSGPGDLLEEIFSIISSISIGLDGFR